MCEGAACVTVVSALPLGKGVACLREEEARGVTGGGNGVLLIFTCDAAALKPI